jgi:hypothetical protein
MSLLLKQSQRYKVEADALRPPFGFEATYRLTLGEMS